MLHNKSCEFISLCLFENLDPWTHTYFPYFPALCMSGSVDHNPLCLSEDDILDHTSEITHHLFVFLRLAYLN